MEGPLWDKVSADSKRLVSGLLSVEPARRMTAAELLTNLGLTHHDNTFKLADMTKADLYKRRNKNKQRKSSSEPSTSSEIQMETDEPQENSLLETINNLKNRMNKNSIENDVELIKANTLDTPVNETEPSYNDIDDVPSVKPVEKTYAKSRSKLDDYIYIESSQGLDGTEVAFPKGNRSKKSKDTSPVPRKRRKMETRQTKKEVNGRQLRSQDKPTPEKRSLRNRSVDKSRVTKESIENEKTVVTRATRKRKHEELTKPVLREKGQNGRSSRKNSESTNVERKIVRARKTKAKPLALEVDAQNVRMTRSRRRRLEISLSPSEVKSVMPAFSFESDRRMNSIESSRSAKSSNANTKAKRQNANAKAKAKAKPAKTASKAKKTPVRSTRSRANRR